MHSNELNYNAWKLNVPTTVVNIRYDDQIKTSRDAKNLCSGSIT